MVVLAVELPVEEIAGVAVGRRPHLEAGGLVAAVDGHLGGAHVVGAKGRPFLCLWPLVGSDHQLAFGQAPVGTDHVASYLAHHASPFDDVGVGEKVIQLPLGQELLKARLVTPVIVPVGRAIAALGQPDAPGRTPEVTAIGPHTDRQLAVDGGIPFHERQVAVCGGAGDDVQIPLVLQVAEGAHQVSAEAFLESLQNPSIPVVVEPSQVEEMAMVCFLVTLDVGFDQGQLFLEIELEMGQHVAVGQLLQQDGRQADGQLGFVSLVLQVVEGVEQGDVGFGHGFVDHFLSVGPAPRFAYVG